MNHEKYTPINAIIQNMIDDSLQESSMRKTMNYETYESINAIIQQMIDDSLQELYSRVAQLEENVTIVSKREYKDDDKV